MYLVKNFLKRAFMLEDKRLVIAGALADMNFLLQINSNMIRAMERIADVVEEGKKKRITDGNKLYART